MFNTLPKHIRMISSCSVNKFKSQLDKLLRNISDLPCQPGYNNSLDGVKLIEVISEAGLQQMQREPTSGQNLLDLFCCNKPSLVKACISIPEQNLKRKKGRRFKKAKKFGMDEDMARYLDIEKMVKRQLRDAERVYVNGILQNGLESGNNKPFWKYVKSPKKKLLVSLLLKVTATRLKIVYQRRKF